MRADDPNRAPIRAAEAGAAIVFSTETPFSTNLVKLSDPLLPFKPNHNQYIVRGDAVITEEEMIAAKENQIKNGVDYLKFDTHTPIPSDLLQSFGLNSLLIYTMLLQPERAADWKTNPDVVIKDVKVCPEIEDDILQSELDNYGQNGIENATKKMRRMIGVAKESPQFQYYAAYVDGEMAGACHVFNNDGFAGLDCLIVNPKFRGKYVATTLMAYAAKLFDYKLYLHTAITNTSTQMYLKMGFEAVDVTYECIVRGILPRPEAEQPPQIAKQ